MKNPLSLFSFIRKRIEKKGMLFLRLSLGLVFLWFGFLKFFESKSPAEEIAAKTIEWLTAGYMTKEPSILILAILECIIGIGFFLKKTVEYVIPIMYFQMIGTLLPLFIFPDATWTQPFVPTLLGQYIIKNTILIAAAIILGVVANGGHLITNPEVAAKAKAIEKSRDEDEY